MEIGILILIFFYAKEKQICMLKMHQLIKYLAHGFLLKISNYFRFENEKARQVKIKDIQSELFAYRC